MNPLAGAQSRRSPDWLWATAMALGLAFVVWQVTTAGSWLDEFWQLWISDAPANLLPARLAADSHAPWFNLLTRPIVFIKAGVVATPNGAVLLISPADRLHPHS